MENQCSEEITWQEGLTEVPRLKDDDAQLARHCCIVSKRLGKVVCNRDTCDPRADDADICIGCEGSGATFASEGIYARCGVCPERVRGVGHRERR